MRKGIFFGLGDGGIEEVKGKLDEFGWVQTKRSFLLPFSLKTENKLFLLQQT